MKKWILLVICSAVSFVIGTALGTWTKQSDEVTGNASSSVYRTFYERSSLYLLTIQGDQEKIKRLLESLIYGDLIALGIIQFSKTKDAAATCLQLNRLYASSAKEVAFSSELVALRKSCSK